MQVHDTRRATRRKISAIAAGGAVLGLGVTATLAAWTDTEWVFGGDGSGGAGIGTSTFSVQQSTAPFTAWGDQEANPGGQIVFSLGAEALTPGDEVYAGFALRTAPTSIAGDVELQPAVAAAGVSAVDPAGLLFGALEVRVVTAPTPFTCEAGAFAGGTGAPTLIADGALASTGGSVSQSLAAAAGSTQYYCVELELPASILTDPDTAVDEYMGRSVAPAWEFTAES